MPVSPPPILQSDLLDDRTIRTYFLFPTIMQTIRPRLPDLDDDDENTAPEGFVPSANVFRKAPPEVSSKPKSRFAQRRESERHSAGMLAGERFELDLDDEPEEQAPQSGPKATPGSMITEVKERNIGNVAPPTRPAHNTGFPKPTRRPLTTPGKKESRFKASLREKETQPAVPVDSLHSEIDSENTAALGKMSEEEIEEEQARLMEMLGPDMVEFLRARNGAAGPSSPPESASPLKSSRSVRFNEDVAYSNRPSRSRSPPARGKPIILPSSDDPTIVNWLQDEAAQVGSSHQEVEEGTPEDIRRRFFPEEPMSASLDWTGENEQSEEIAMKPVIKFDLQGNQVTSFGLIDHSSEAHRHAGSDQTFTLPELVQLAQSAVAGQRTLALQIIQKALSSNLDTESPAQALLASSDSINQVGAVCARGLADKHVGVVNLSISIFNLYATNMRTKLNTAAAVLTAQPPPLHSFSRLLSAQTASVELHRDSQLAILETLVALLEPQEDFVSGEYIEAPQLLENGAKIFLQLPWPPANGSSLPDPAAIHLLASIISRSRANAEHVISRRLEQSAMRYIAVPPWQVDDEHQDLAFKLAGNTLRIFSEYANFGLGCSTLTTSASLFRGIEAWMRQNQEVNEEFSKSWFDLLESWSLCAVDPHSTTPEHDILWVETKDWGDHCFDAAFERFPASGTITIIIIRALSAWLAGGKRHDKPAFRDMQARLRGASENLRTLVADASSEHITEEKAKLLLALKKLVNVGEIGDALGDRLAVLEGVQVEEAPLQEEEEGEWM